MFQFGVRRPLAAAPILALTAASILLSGCLTKRVRDQPSQAILDTRAAARQQAAVSACAGAASTPVFVGFGFNEGNLTELQQPYLDPALTWAQCNPGAPIVILPASDGHGTEAEQQDLAKLRGQAVAAYLQAHGVTAPVTVLTQGAAEPAGTHLLVQAQGRRW
jgi:outer membrane protein OmpA-like peptidoglycan-associated protein